MAHAALSQLPSAAACPSSRLQVSTSVSKFGVFAEAPFCVERRRLRIAYGSSFQQKKRLEWADKGRRIIFTAAELKDPNSKRKNTSDSVTIPNRGLPEPTTANIAENRASGAESAPVEASKGQESAVRTTRSTSNLSAEEIGQELSRLRQQRQTDGAGLPDKQDFWPGVWKETQLIEWPGFSTVLGTTTVVVGIILGSSVVLLTLNAVLAQLSDVVFENPLVKEFWGI